MVAEFEADLIRMRTREGMAVAKAKGRQNGKQPKLSNTLRKNLLTLHDAGEHTQAELAELFRASRTTVYRELQRRSLAPTTRNATCASRFRIPILRGPGRRRCVLDTFHIAGTPQYTDRMRGTKDVDRFAVPLVGSSGDVEVST